MDRNPQKDPERWATGDEPMTGPQQSYLETLAQEAGEEPPPDDLSKAEASERIEELQDQTDRGCGGAGRRPGRAQRADCHGGPGR